MNKNDIEVSIIIVNWNSGNYLEETINSVIEKSADINYEIILVDNNSFKNDKSKIFIDNKLANYPNTKIINLDENKGFGPANNIGVEHSCGKNVFFLNPDVILKDNTVKILSQYLDENKEVGIIGPKVLNQNGTFQSSCMRGEPKPIAVFFHLSKLKIFKNHPEFYTFSLANKNIEQINQVAGLSGCCMMAKKELLDRIGAFDEQFFLYQEETDLCYRAVKAGWKLIYNPKTSVIHYQGVTTKANLAKNMRIFCESMMKFFKKHHWQNYNIFQKIFWTLLIWGNFVLKYLTVKFRRAN